MLGAALLLAAVAVLTGCGPTTVDTKPTECPELAADMVRDADADGYAEGLDCDDSDPLVGAPSGRWLDADGDGYGDPDHPLDGCLPATQAVANGNDCDDRDAELHPAVIWWYDDDGDGYGDPLATVSSCVQPTGTVANGDDCDDGDDSVHPDAAELCDGVDQDCDGELDNGAERTTWYPDADGDGYGSDDLALAVTACAPADLVGNPAAWSLDGSDCDDWRSDTHPGAESSWSGEPLDCS